MVIIAGGGLSGLTAAFYLKRANIPFLLLDPQPRLGGVMRTDRIEGCTVEGGPDSWLAAKPWAMELMRDTGLDGEVIGCNEHNRRVWIWRYGRLIEYPEGFQLMVPTSAMAILRSPLLSAGAKARMAAEWFRRPIDRPPGDRSVAEFVCDHFGQEAVDYLAEPLLSGIYGGEPSLLSAQSVLPKFIELERKYGSVARGVQKEPAKRSGPSFQALKGGFGQLIDRLSVDYRRAAIETVEPGRIRAGGEWIEASHVILACGTQASAAALQSSDPELAAMLAAIRYSSATVVTLGYRREQIQHQLNGFGFLVPKKERNRMTACTWVNSKWEYRAPPDRLLFRCFIGDTAPEAETEAVNGLRTYMGIAAEPLFTRVYPWRNSMAQYHVGHQEKIVAIEKQVATHPGLTLLGNAFHGVGIPDCIREAQRAARQLIGDN